jgi:hypothetical protein
VRAHPRAYYIQAYVNTFEIILTTFTEKAGVNTIAIFTELRNGHGFGDEDRSLDIFLFGFLLLNLSPPQSSSLATRCPFSINSLANLRFPVFSRSIRYEPDEGAIIMCLVHDEQQ